MKSMLQSLLKFFRRTARWWIDLFKQSGGKGKIAWGCSTILGLCFLLTLCSVPFQDPEPTAVSETGMEEATASPLPTETNSPETTDTPDVTATATAVPTNTPPPPNTKTPTPTPTSTTPPSPTPEPQPQIQVDVDSANIRSGPGLAYPFTSTVSEGEMLEVVATNGDGSWYLVSQEGNEIGWIAASIVTEENPDLFDQIAVAATLPPPPASPTPRATLAPTSPPTSAPTTVPPTATQPPAPQPGQVVIVGVNKQSEYVDLQNIGGSEVDLAGWRLVSEKGNQACTLGGVIQPGGVLRVWALVEDADQGGYNCNFGRNIWNNSEPDPAVLYNPDGVEVSRR